MPGRVGLRRHALRRGVGDEDEAVHVADDHGVAQGREQRGARLRAVDRQAEGIGGAVGGGVGVHAMRATAAQAAPAAG